MPNQKINWVNDHIQIRDRLEERVRLLGDYLNSKPNDFDGTAAKRFLLSQAREQVSWHRLSIEALDFVESVTCRRVLETCQPFLEHYLPAYNFRETKRGTEYKCDPAFPTLPELWSRPNSDNDERFDDVGETPDTGIKENKKL